MSCINDDNGRAAPLLQVSRVDAGYGDVQLLADVSVSVSPGEIVALLGPNGSGKSTLMRTIIGLVSSWSGSVVFDGRDITKLPCHERVAAGLGMVPPGRRLFLGMSVEENLLMGAYLGLDRREIAEGLESAYAFFPVLRDCRRRNAAKLSGGQQQMCAIARGLMSKPKLLMIDELSLGLSPIVVEELVATLVRIRREQKITLVLVEQDVHAAMGIADFAYIMSGGEVAIAGPSASLMQGSDISDCVKAVFMGTGSGDGDQEQERRA